MSFLFGIIIVILDAITLYQVLGSRKDAENKFLWTVVILLLPVFGLILYYLFGRRNS